MSTQIEPDVLKVFLHAPEMLYLIGQVNKHVVNETDNILYTLLTIVAKDSVEIRGATSSGKNTVGDAVTSLLPNGWVLTFTGITDKVIRYLPEHVRVLYIKEKRALKSNNTRSNEESTAEYDMKVAISEGKLMILSTVKDKESPTGFSAYRSEIIIDSFLITTTAEVAPEEYENRFHFVRARDDRKQSEAVTAFDLDNVTKPSWQRIKINENGRELVKKALEDLDNKTKHVDFVIPYATRLKDTFDHSKPSVRRSVKKFLKMIGTIAKLHYYQRPVITGPNGEKNVIALPEDLRLLIAIGERSLIQTLGLMSKPIADTLKYCENLDDKGIEITVRNVFDAFLADDIQVSEPTIYKRLETLVKKGFLVRKEIPKDENTKKPLKNANIYEYIHLKTVVPSFDRITNKKFLADCETDVRTFLNSVSKTVSLNEYRDYVDPITGEREMLHYTENITKDNDDCSNNNTVLRTDTTNNLHTSQLPEQNTVLRTEKPIFLFKPIGVMQ